MIISRVYYWQNICIAVLICSHFLQFVCIYIFYFARTASLSWINKGSCRCDDCPAEPLMAPKLGTVWTLLCLELAQPCPLVSVLLGFDTVWTLFRSPDSVRDSQLLSLLLVRVSAMQGPGYIDSWSQRGSTGLSTGLYAFGTQWSREKYFRQTKQFQGNTMAMPFQALCSRQFF